MNKFVIGIGAALIAGFLIGYMVFGEGSESAITDSNHGHSETEMWTCSMHPQIMLPEAGKCPICGMDLIPAHAGENTAAPGKFLLTSSAVALADIQTTRISVQAGASGIQKLSGTLTPNENTTTTQSIYYDGRIEQLFVYSVGESITQGKLLAKVYAPELISAQQELLSISKLKNSQPELYTAVRSKLEFWKLSQAQIKAIEESGKIIDNFPLYSSVSGNITEISTKAGDYVKKGQALLRVANFNSLWAEFYAYEPQLASLREGMELALTFNALPGSNFTGKISYISPVLETASRTATVRVVVPNPKGILKPGMFVEAKIAKETDRESGSLVVPESAVLWTGTRSVVYLKSNPLTPEFEMREITLGSRFENGYEVLSGLEEGDEVVTRGAFTVDAAAQLNGQRSMMRQSSEVTIDTEFIPIYRQILNRYIELKDALVSSDSDSVLRVSENAVRDLTDLPPVEQVQEVMDFFKNLVITKNIDGQREIFRMLSEVMVKYGTAIPHHQQTFYLQYCPMANSNQGATWISQFQEIRNPYFGEAMLSCGEIRNVWNGN
jgi:Cu(I)/Ag(I) efflux system membrane fusion protein